MVLRHRSLFRECDSDSDVLCGGIKQGEGFVKRESNDIDTSKQEDQEQDNDDYFYLRKTAVVHRTLFILTPLLFILQTNVLSLTLPENSDDLLLPIHQVLPGSAVYEVLCNLSHKVESGNMFFFCSEIN